MRTQTLNMYLEHFLAENTRDIRLIRSFNEAETMEKSKYVLDNMIQFVMKKTSSIEYDAIEMTKGDITKLKEYKTLKDSIIALQTLKSQVGSNCQEINELEIALRNIESLKNNFELGFKVNNKTVILLYCNLVVALICSTSFIISTHIELVKDHTTNDYKTVMKRTSTGTHNMLFIKNLTKFNKSYASGEVQKFLSVSLDKRAMTSVAIAGTVISVGIVIIPLMRELIYQYYSKRVELADYLRLQADFLVLNQNNLTPNSSQARKQSEVAKSLIKLADKIDVDMKVSSKKATSEIIDENKTLKLDTPFHTTDNIDSVYGNSSNLLL